MNSVLIPIAKWGARAHLVGVGLVLAYGLDNGNLLAGWDNTLIYFLFNPFFIGLSISTTGVAKTIHEAMEAEKRAQNAKTYNTEEMDLDDDDSSDFSLFENRSQIERDEADFSSLNDDFISFS